MLQNLQVNLNHDKITINDHQVYPSTSSISVLGTLRRLSDNEISPSLSIGYSLEMLSDLRKDSNGNQNPHFRLTVLDVAGFPVSVETLNMDMTQKPEGDLYFAHYMVGPVQFPGLASSWRVCGKNPTCLRTAVAFRLKQAFISARIRAASLAKMIASGFKGCHHHGKPSQEHYMNRPADSASLHRPHSHHSHRGHGSVFFETFYLVLKSVLFGILISALGYGIGLMIKKAVLTVRAYYFHRARPTAMLVEEGKYVEKENLVHNDEIPQYEDLEGEINPSKE